MQTQAEAETETYYLKRRHETEWRRVSKEEFIQAERAAGFRPPCASTNPDYWTTTATASFTGEAMEGRTVSAGRHFPYPIASS